MQPVITKKLESLSPDVQEWLLDLTAHARRLADVIKPLRERGIEVSVSTLTRFVREHRERVVLADGEGMKAGAEAMASQGNGDALRRGTLQAVRQRLFEDALSPTNSTEETRKLYVELLKEEGRLKELELAERKLALVEEQTRLQKVRLRLQARSMGGRTRIKLDSDAVNVVEGAAGGGGTEKQIEGPGEKMVEANRRLVGVVTELAEILNRAGSTDEKVLEARRVLAEGA